jgi:Family of unknown function (DUF6152)
VTNAARRAALVAGLGIMFLGIMATPALSHHSFAMYDQSTTKTMTGKLVRYIPGANHAQLIFDVLGPDGKPVMQNGKPVQWGVETGSAAAIARQGVAPKTFPEGTIFTVTLYPLRDGRPFGAMAGLLIKCGATMPAGGCTKATGEVLISAAGPA